MVLECRNHRIDTESLSPGQSYLRACHQSRENPACSSAPSGMGNSTCSETKMNGLLKLKNENWPGNHPPGQPRRDKLPNYPVSYHLPWQEYTSLSKRRAVVQPEKFRWSRGQGKEKGNKKDCDQETSSAWKKRGPAVQRPSQ